jgi:hypothetical protein
LFANGWVLLPDSDDDLQGALHALHNITNHSGRKISYEEEKDITSKIRYIFTNSGNSEQRLQAKFSPKTISIERILQQFSYPIRFIWL